MPQKDRSFLYRVRDAMPTLHPAERRLGEFVCDLPGEVASYSASEIADLAHVSKATVSRFVQKLGYKNYDEARRHARAEKQTGSRFYLSTKNGVTNGQTIAAHLAQNITNIEMTFASMTDAQVEAMASALLGARKVWVLGFRASHSFAAYLQWQLTQVMENIAAIPGAGQTLGEHLVSVAKEDVVVFFGLRRRIASTGTILNLIEKTGAKLLYVTDEGADFHANASWHVRCHTLAPGPLFSHVSVMAFCHLLITRCLECAAVDGRTRLRDIEGLNEILEEL